MYIYIYIYLIYTYTYIYTYLYIYIYIICVYTYIYNRLYIYIYIYVQICVIKDPNMQVIFHRSAVFLLMAVQAARRIVARLPRTAQGMPFSTPCMAWCLWRNAIDSMGWEATNLGVHGGSCRFSNSGNGVKLATRSSWAPRVFPKDMERWTRTIQKCGKKQVHFEHY